MATNERMTAKQKAKKYLKDYANRGVLYIENGDFIEICEAYLETFDEVKPDYEAECKRLSCKVDELTAEKKELEAVLNNENDYAMKMRGKIEAYEFVIRCNGVSGENVTP